MDNIAVEFLILGFILVQSLVAWFNMRNQRSKEELGLLRSTNAHVKTLEIKVAAMQKIIDERGAELDILRPLAAQVPVLETQLEALRTEFQNCLEWKQKQEELINRGTD